MIFYSIHFNRPDFIEIQKKCIDHIGGSLVVIENSFDMGIQEECKRLGIKIYKTPETVTKSPSHSHGESLNFTTKIIDYTKDWCLLDHDFFPLESINFENYEILGNIQSRNGLDDYLWPGFLAGKNYINLSEIDFLPANGKDTGAGTSSLISSGYKIRGVSEHYLGFDENITDPLQIQPGIVQFENFGFHYLNGSGWMKIDTEKEKIKKCFLLKNIDLFLNKNNLI